MNVRRLVITALFWPMHAAAIGYPSFTTEIPGVQLWVLDEREDGFTEEGFGDEENEFIRYCDGTRSIYVGSLSSPVRCQSQSNGDRTYRIRLKTGDKHPSGLVVISKTPLPSRAQSLVMTKDESERLRTAEKAPAAALAKEAKRRYRESFADLNDEAAYAQMLRNTKAEATYRKHGGGRFKISSPTGFIFVSAIGLFPGGLGWDIENVVFREIDGRLRKVGTFSGCIEGFRDLDADGTPEVLTRLCENSEGTQDIFWSLTPTVRPVVMRSQ